MKKFNLLSSLAVLVALVGCDGEVSSSMSTSSSLANSTTSLVGSSTSTSSSSTSTSTSSSSTSTSSSSSPVEVQVDLLKDLKEGFAVRSVFTEQVIMNENETQKDPTISLVETFIGEGVAKVRTYKGTSFEDEELSVKSVTQYENDEEGKAYQVSVDTLENPVKTPLLLVDSILNENVEAFWSETNLDNVFKTLENENFIKQDDGSYDLDMSQVSDKQKEAISNQFYMYYESANKCHFYNTTTIDSFTLNVDEEGTVSSYEATFETYQIDTSGWGDLRDKTVSLAGEFIGLGANQITKLSSQAEVKYQELEDALSSLRNGNYTARIHRTDADDWSKTNESIDVKADGKGNFEVSYVNAGDWSTTTKKFGYKQIDETTYSRYMIYDDKTIYDGGRVEGNVLTDVLPGFEFSSNLFEKDPNSTENCSIYRIVLPELINKDYIYDSDITNFGFAGNAGTIYKYDISNLVIEVTPQYVRFSSVYNKRAMEAKFFFIGSTKTISTSVKEVSSFVSGTYEAKTNVHRYSVALSAAFEADNKVTITADGNVLGTFDYVYDSDNNIVVSGLKDVSFTFTGKDWSDNEFEVSCYIEDTLTLKNLKDVTFAMKLIYQRLDTEVGSNTTVEIKKAA